MKYVISATGEPWRFSLGAGNVFNFDVSEPTAISEAHYAEIVARVGNQVLKIVDAPASQEAQVEEQKETAE
jgi:hypothetical protein